MQNNPAPTTGDQANYATIGNPTISHKGLVIASLDPSDFPDDNRCEHEFAYAVAGSQVFATLKVYTHQTCPKRPPLGGLVGAARELAEDVTDYSSANILFLAPVFRSEVA